MPSTAKRVVIFGKRDGCATAASIPGEKVATKGLNMQVLRTQVTQLMVHICVQRVAIRLARNARLRHDRRQASTL